MARRYLLRMNYGEVRRVLKALERVSNDPNVPLHIRRDYSAFKEGIEAKLYKQADKLYAQELASDLKP